MPKSMKSFQQCLLVNGVKDFPEAKAYHYGTVLISTYVGNIIGDVGYLLTWDNNYN